MITASRVYLTRLAGLTVRDPDGDIVGKVRDVVLTLRSDDSPARVIGLVVEITRGRQSFVPISHLVAADHASIRLSTGTVSMRKFELRPHEVLAIAQLLDRQVTIKEDGVHVTLVDVAMEQTRTRDWLVQKVAVRERAHRLSRGHVRQLDWDEVSGIAVERPQQETASLLEEFEDQRAADVAARIRDLPDQRRQEIAEALDDDRLADVLEELPEGDQREILAQLDDDRAADVLSEMDPDDAADLLGDLPAGERERLLGLMEPDEAAPVRQLLSYGEHTAGGVMTSQPVILPPDTTIAEALAHVRREEFSPALASQVYVTRPPSITPTGHFLGVVHIQRLLREPPFEQVGSILDDDLDPLSPDTDLNEITRYFATYNLVAAPVVDDAGRLVGAVTVDDLLDHLLPEDWREHDG
ncbi:magnesium transporter MgtE N-terminal domain-containing protein [Blastococcus sp. Marseille-P5729]|uniref:magnesium transporter MgtE N-terminal domain-containing protein n=1 Tax=Blastococcus sp. Marseille-P5729 TaxID=2086582 RepID=UPI000D0E9F60|nr:CBS domain-containing protein [Blastococcus sp. Marseille-P5729]